MLIYLILQLIISMLGVIFFWIPNVTMASLPIVGTSIDSTMIWLLGSWNALLITFPYGLVAWNVLRYVILPFELFLLITKFFLGSRMPVHRE